MKPSSLTILSYLRDLAQKQPEKRMIGSEAGWLSASEVLAAIDAIACRLLAAGLHSESFAALRADRTPETILMILALRRIGAAAVLTDPHTDCETALSDCSAAISVDALITPSGDSFRLCRLSDGEVFTIPSAAGPSADIDLPEDAGKPGFVIFTSGSTGKKKAVVLSDYNLVNNLVDSEPLGCYSEDDIALGVLPLEHVFGLVLLAGIAVLHYAIYMPGKTDIPGILDTIEQAGITRMNGVPSLYQAMAEQSKTRDLSSLRAGFIGGAPASPAQVIELEQKLGMTLIPVYGMSECIGISCADGREPAAVRCDGVGRIYSMNTVKLLDADGKPAPVGEPGEIWVNGPARMLGYWGDTMEAEEFLCTGDLGRLDENGTLHICGRIKDIIIRNGRNISPVRIEEALLSLPGVRAAAVVGLPDAQAGEVPCAMVAGSAEPSQLTVLLPKNEIPTGILCVDALPMTYSGKPDKVRIREVLNEWKNG